MSRPVVIGIAGGTASGKSTFSQALEKELSGLRVRVFHMDDYFKPEAERPRITAPVSGIEYRDDNHPGSLKLDLLAADFQQALSSSGWDVVVIEGLFALREEFILRELDLKLYVDCLADERIVRRIRRNLAWGQEFNEITTRYLDAVRCRHDELIEPTRWRADMILNGSHPSEQALAMIVGWVRERCR